jgi:hypothetical protein
MGGEPLATLGTAVPIFQMAACAIGKTIEETGTNRARINNNARYEELTLRTVNFKHTSWFR